MRREERRAAAAHGTKQSTDRSDQDIEKEADR